MDGFVTTGLTRISAVSTSPRARRASPHAAKAERAPVAGRMPAAAPGEIRLIGGRWKRSKLPVLAAPGLRPTPDRVRETLFNWLGQDLAGWRVLDAFAGSGALGFEAASRGAAEVVLVEQDTRLARHLDSVGRRLDASMVRVVCDDAVAWMRRRVVADLDLVLLDPPFGLDLFATAVQAALPLLAPEGWIYLEADRAWTEADAAACSLRLHRQGRAGQVHFHLLQRNAIASSHYTGA